MAINGTSGDCVAKVVQNAPFTYCDVTTGKLTCGWVAAPPVVLQRNSLATNFNSFS